MDKYTDMIRDISLEYIELIVDIIEYAKSNLKNKFNNRLLIILSDYICFAVEYNKGIIL